MIRQCCCDPHKLTYISAIIAAIDAVLFGVLNVVLICMKTCVIQPPSEGGSFFDIAWAWYFYDPQACTNKGHADPPWIKNATYPLDPRPGTTTPQANFIYQSTYLVLHVLWFIASIILIYGNARKRWGYYLPWLTVTLVLLIMDVVISSFYISDMVKSSTTAKEGSAMFFILALYFRLFIFWIINLSEFGNAFNAFCKSYHKRSKQGRLQKEQQQQHAQEMTAAVAEAEAKVRAEYEQQPRPPPLQQPHPQPPPVQYNQFQQAGYNNLAFEDQPPPQPRKQPPPVPKKPKAPPGARPFNYLNPHFRPDNPSDLEGMRAHAIQIPDSPTRLLKKSTMYPEESAYFPSDSYSRPTDLRSNGARRHDSMRNFRTQEPPRLNRRYASARGDPRRIPYTPPPDYDQTLGRPRRGAPDHQNPQRRANPESSSSVRQGYHKPPVSPSRPNNQPPISPTRPYSPHTASSSGHYPSYRPTQPAHSQGHEEDVLYF